MLYDIKAELGTCRDFKAFLSHATKRFSEQTQTFSFHSVTASIVTIICYRSILQEDFLISV